MSITEVDRPRTEPAPQPSATRWPFSVSVVIPAMNEGQTIGRVIRAVQAQCPDAEIVVVDDASRDNTADEAAAAGARVIRRPYNIGNGAGVKTGVRAATGDVVVVIDADGQHDPADIPRLLAYIDRYDMVIATRPDRTSQQNAVRWLGNNALNAFGSYLVQMELKDLTSGFRAMRRSVLLELLHLLPNKFGWPVTTALAFATAGYHIRFEPIAMHKRDGRHKHAQAVSQRREQGADHPAHGHAVQPAARVLPDLSCARSSGAGGVFLVDRERRPLAAYSAFDGHTFSGRDHYLLIRADLRADRQPAL